MSFTFWFVVWVVGALLILGTCITSIGRNDALDEGGKTIAITLATLLWPIALVYGCLNSWRMVLEGK